MSRLLVALWLLLAGATGVAAQDENACPSGESGIEQVEAGGFCYALDTTCAVIIYVVESHHYLDPTLDTFRLRVFVNTPDGFEQAGDLTFARATAELVGKKAGDWIDTCAEPEGM